MFTFLLLLEKDLNPQLTLDLSSLLKAASVTVSRIRLRCEDEKLTGYIAILLDN